jgi:prevent-host-death family protein
MREIGAFEAKNRFGALLGQVEHGEEIVITRRGKPIAKLVPAGPSFDRAKARRAVAGLLEVSRGGSSGWPRDRQVAISTSGRWKVVAGSFVCGLAIIVFSIR